MVQGAVITEWLLLRGRFVLRTTFPAGRSWHVCLQPPTPSAGTGGARDPLRPRTSPLLTSFVTTQCRSTSCPALGARPQAGGGSGLGWQRPTERQAPTEKAHPPPPPRTCPAAQGRRVQDEGPVQPKVVS